MFDKVQQLRNDDNAVSPVIGVILMVAVTVVLAAVIGAFVFGMGDSLNDPAPNAQISFSENADGSIDVLMDGGDTINQENTGQLVINGSTVSIPADGFTAGDTITTTGTSPPATFDVVWESPDGGNSQVISTYEA